MAIKLDITLPGLERQIKNLAKINMGKIGVEALDLNSQQIESKEDRKGKTFKPYSVKYAKKKGVSRNAVDLISNAKSVANKTTPKKSRKPFGTMLISYGQIAIKRNIVVLGFRGIWDRQKARFNVAGIKQTKREFVGLKKGNRKKLISFVFKLLTRGTF